MLFTTPMTNNNPTHEEALKTVKELLKDIQVFMLTTVQKNGELHSRPMGMEQSNFNGTLWFFTQKSSNKVDAIEQNQQVNVACSDPKSQKYLSLSGTAELTNDTEKMKELWNPYLEIWFPKGIDDPDITLLKITVESAEYWDSPSNPVVRFLAFAKSMVTKDDESLSTNKEVDL